MAYFAKIDENNVVVDIIKASQEFIDSGKVGDPSMWLQASYNTRGGVHYQRDTGTASGFAGLRKNYPGVGYTYDPIRDAFIPPKPYDSWVLNEDTCMWMAPVPKPDTTNFYRWDEDNVQWVQIPIEELNIL